MRIQNAMLGALLGSLLLADAASAQQPPPEKAPSPRREGSAARRPPDGPPPDNRGPVGFEPRPRDPNGRGPGRPPGPGAGPREGRFGAGPPGPGMPPMDLERLQQHDPEMHQLLVSDDELDRQTLEIVEQFRRARAEEREKLKASLIEVVGKHFEVRQQRRELQLKRMEEEIQRLRDAIKTRNEARQEIVNKRITELTGEANPLDF